MNTKEAMQILIRRKDSYLSNTDMAKAIDLAIKALSESSRPAADQTGAENTIENAKVWYLDKWQHDPIEPNATRSSQMAQYLFEYAASVRPDVVLPMIKPLRKLNDSEYVERKTWNDCLSEIRRLNPGINFIESK